MKSKNKLTSQLPFFKHKKHKKHTQMNKIKEKYLNKEVHFVSGNLEGRSGRIIAVAKTDKMYGYEMKIKMDDDNSIVFTYKTEHIKITTQNTHRPIHVIWTNPDNILIPKDWKKAEGIDATPEETNRAYASRNYEVECKTGKNPIIIVEGYHIWWCITHHQPLYVCDR